MGNLDFQAGKNNVDLELDKLFAKAPTDMSIQVELPSKGKFYRSGGSVRVSPLLFEDEQRILSMKAVNANPINEIIEKCVHGLDVKELLQMDKSYLLMRIKEVSYGPNYEFTLTCPACKQINNVNLNLSNDLIVNKVPDDLQDPREVDLPVLGVKAIVRFPRNYEESYISDLESYADNMYRFVVSIDGNDNVVFVSKAIKKMHIRDRKVISNAINMPSIGVDPRFQFTCAGCGHTEIKAIPFSPSFFSVS